jgi:hypothetical protein
VRWYDRIVAQFGTSHPTLAKMSQRRADYLRNEVIHTDANAARPAVTTPVNAGSRQGTTSSVFERDNRSATAGATRTDTSSMRTYRGWLSPASGRINNQQKYLLDMRQTDGEGVVIVVAGPGVNPGPWVSRRVDVSGPVTYDSESRMWVMQAMQLTPAE